MNKRYNNLEFIFSSECIGCDKYASVNEDKYCKKCVDKHECEGCQELNESCICSNDRGDSDFNERGGFTPSYIDHLNKGEFA